MNIVATNKKLRELLRGIKTGSLVPQPEFQRRLVWTNKDKVNFIDTVLKELPFPEIYIAASEVDLSTGESIELLVDGQQRLTTLYQYFVGSSDLRLGRAILPYAGLSDAQKNRFLEYDVVVRYIGEMSIDEIKDVFRRINSTSYSLNAMEIRNARYNGQFKHFGEQIANHPFFEEHRVFSANEVRRMDDVRFALNVTVTTMSTYFNRDDELESFLETYNDEFDSEDDLRREIEEIFRFIDQCQFRSKSDVWKRSNLFTGIIELHRAIIKQGLDLSPSNTGDQIENWIFGTRADGNPNNLFPISLEERDAYRRASLQGTNDRGSRIRRGEIMAKVIRSASVEEGTVSTADI